ncbi:hypothetical protein D3C77_362780 [compost metagenome]
MHEESDIILDEWLKSLGNWSNELLGDICQVYVGALGQEVTSPYVLWELTGMEMQNRGMTSYETIKTVTATIVNDNPLQETMIMTQLMEGLAQQHQLTLEGDSPRYVSITSSKGSVTKTVQPEPKRECVITLTLSGRTSILQPETKVMQGIQYQEK